MVFPEIFVFDADEPEDRAGDALAQFTADLGIEAPFVMWSRHGRRLAAGIRHDGRNLNPPSGADQEWAGELGSSARRAGADAVVAIGGGRCLDLAKLAAARAELTVIAVPTQLSHDGICSPVAVVPNATGKAESLGAITPLAVFLSLPNLVNAPLQTVVAGLGDLLANPFALRDWAMAIERGFEESNDRARGLSVESFELVEPHLDDDPATLAKDPEFVRLLADALVKSGQAMICAGTSRPASGGEHEISHAMDERYGGRALHGAQVAFGCIFSAALYGDDVDAFRRRLARLGLPQHPEELGLSRDEVAQLLLAAPATRPGRFTVIEDADLDKVAAKALVEKIWGGG